MDITRKINTYNRLTAFYENLKKIGYKSNSPITLRDIKDKMANNTEERYEMENTFNLLRTFHLSGFTSFSPITPNRKSADMIVDVIRSEYVISTKKYKIVDGQGIVLNQVDPLRFLLESDYQNAVKTIWGEEWEVKKVVTGFGTRYIYAIDMNKFAKALDNMHQCIKGYIESKMADYEKKYVKWCEISADFN